MLRKAAIFAVPLCAGLVTACASIVQKPEQNILVTSDPPGATVQVRDQTITTPGKVTLKRNEDYSVRVAKEGYYDNVALVRHRESEVLYGNILWDLPTTGLYMFITQGMRGPTVVGPGSTYDRYTGAGYKLVPNKINLALEPRPPGEESKDTVAPLRLKVAQEISLPGQILGLQAGNGSLWITHGDGGTWKMKTLLSRVDTGSGEILATLPMPQGRNHVVSDDNALWYITTKGKKRELQKWDLATQQVVARFGLPDIPILVPHVAAGAGAVWVLAVAVPRRATSDKPLEVEVLRFDSHTHQVNSIFLDPAIWGPVKGQYRAAAISAGPNGVWVYSVASRNIARIDPATLQLAAVVSVGQRVLGVHSAEEFSFVAGPALTPEYDAPTQITLIHHQTNRVSHSIFAGGIKFPHPGAVGLGKAWLLNREEGTLEWIDGASAQRGVERLDLEPPLKNDHSLSTRMAVADGSVWLGRGKQLYRITPE